MQEYPGVLAEPEELREIMKKIASFTINHDLLQPGMYISRIDGDCVTYDLRMKVPNAGDYLDQKGLHTLEHLLATYLRNSGSADRVIYTGPMGCRTGFYLVMRDTVAPEDAVRLVREAFRFAADFEGEIPGASRTECGNWLDHDLRNAKAEAAAYLRVLEHCSADTMTYPE